MEHLIKQVLESAKKNKKELLAIKNFAIEFQHAELALKLIDIEREYFPETTEVREIKDTGKK